MSATQLNGENPGQTEDGNVLKINAKSIKNWERDIGFAALGIPDAISSFGNRALRFPSTYLSNACHAFAEYTPLSDSSCKGLDDWRDRAKRAYPIGYNNISGLVSEDPRDLSMSRGSQKSTIAIASIVGAGKVPLIQRIAKNVSNGAYWASRRAIRNVKQWKLKRDDLRDVSEENKRYILSKKNEFDQFTRGLKKVKCNLKSPIVLLCF